MWREIRQQWSPPNRLSKRLKDAVQQLPCLHASGVGNRAETAALKATCGVRGQRLATCPVSSLMWGFGFVDVCMVFRAIPR